MECNIFEEFASTATTICFFFQAEDGIRYRNVTGVQTCALPISNARGVFESYYLSCEANDFDDEATVVYKTSKWANAAKLAMCISASRGDSLEISKDDFELAITKTEEVVEDLKIVFRSVGESPLVSATARVLNFIEHQGYASRAEILSINWKHISDLDLDRIIATLREAEVIAEKYVGKRTMYYVTGNTVPVT